MVSGVIYAEKNSVKKKTLTTILPAYVDLSSEQFEETLAFENMPNRRKAQEIFKVKQTTNPGIWYACLAEWDYIGYLVMNPNLDNDILFLIINRVRSEESNILFSVLGLEAVKNTPKLFGLGFQKYMNFNPTFPVYFSFGASVASTLTVQNVESFLIVLHYYGATELIEPRKFYSQVAYGNQKIIQEWWSGQDDEDLQAMAVIPFSWAMGMLGYTEGL